MAVDLISSFTLPGQVAFVTGGGRGLGRGICVGFAEAGADIVAVSRTAKDLEETAKQVRAKGRRCLPIPCDVTVKAQVDAAVGKALEEFKKIDILVNNAGGVHNYYLMEEMTEEEWDRQVNLNLKAAFLCSLAVGKVMLGQGKGKIVNIGSICGLEAMAGIGPYNAAKAGLHNLTKTLALEWGPKGIWVNCIAAGSINTLAPELLRQSRRKRGLEVVKRPSSQWDLPPFEMRTAEPEQYVPIILFLASPASNHLTGDIISPGGVAFHRS